MNEALAPPSPRVSQMKQQRKKNRCETCGIKTHKVRMTLFGKKRTPLTVPGRVSHGTCLACRHPEDASSFPTQQVFVVRREQDRERQRQQCRDDDSQAETKSTVSEVTLDMRLVPESVWNVLPYEIQQHLSWDRIVPPQVTPVSTRLDGNGVTTSRPQQVVTNLERRSESCCICSCDYIESSRIASINSCQHEFCFACIDKWAACENTCPLCKVRFQKIIVPSPNGTRTIDTSLECETTPPLVVKSVPDRTQPSHNNVLAPFEARTAAAVDSVADSSITTSSSIDSDLVAQVYADLGGLSSPASVGGMPPFGGLMEQNASYEAEYEQNLVRRQAFQRSGQRHL